MEGSKAQCLLWTQGSHLSRGSNSLIFRSFTCKHAPIFLIFLVLHQTLNPLPRSLFFHHSLTHTIHSQKQNRSQKISPRERVLLPLKITQTRQTDTTGSNLKFQYIPARDFISGRVTETFSPRGLRTSSALWILVSESPGLAGFVRSLRLEPGCDHICGVQLLQMTEPREQLKVIVLALLN